MNANDTANDGSGGLLDASGSGSGGLLDACISNNSHFDIANVIHHYLKDRHRYAENNVWEYLKTDVTTKKQSWELDVDNKEFMYSIKTIVCRAFTVRSLYWANVSGGVSGDGSSSDNSDNSGCGSDYPDTEMISLKLLNISSKLKDNKYISVLIKECKQFFV